MQVNELKVKIDVDTKGVSNILDAMLSVRKDLQTQFSLDIFGASLFQHFIPVPESGMSRNKFREILLADFLQVFDSACINHCLECLKVRVLMKEAVR